MMRDAFLALVLGAAVLGPQLTAAETDPPPSTWRPADHPAGLVHRIDGTTRVHRSLVLTAESSARVERILLEEGQRVPEGEAMPVVVELDATLARLATERARAAVAEAEATIPRIEARLAIAERDTAFQRSESERIAQLVADGRLTEREGDVQRYQAERAALQERAIASELAAARAALATAQAAAAEAVERLDRHRLRAPSGWTLSDRLLEPGALVTPGSGVLLLHDARTLEVPLRLTEAEIAALRQRDRIELHFPDHDLRAPATLHRIDVRHDPATRKRLVILHVDGTDAPAPSGGLNAVLELEVERDDGTVRIPTRFLDRDGQVVTVTLVDGRRLPVVPLREDRGMVIVAGARLPADAELVVPDTAP